MPPLLIIFFNRPDIFLKQLLALRQFMPSVIYLAADGPRISNTKDLLKLNECKKLINTKIDWPCKLYFNYSEKNYGCDKFVPKAISWFFYHVDSGIILEDDCIISKEFYRFSAYLLKKFEDDARIMNISASNFQDKKWGDGDYYFSLYPANWAWATWRRAWEHYDPEMSGLEEFLSPYGAFNKIKLEDRERRFWKKFFLGLKADRYTFWDAKWVYAIWKNNGISITPNYNLSTNIGFGSEATHTKDRLKTHALSIYQLGPEIIDPKSRTVEFKADYFLFLKNYRPSFKDFLGAAIDKIGALLK